MKCLFKNSVIVILLYGTAIFLPSCKEEATLPVVTTAVISDITFTSATTGGFVEDEGGAEVTAMGVCWSTGFPTIEDSKTTEGAGSGSFTSIITGLMPGTVYYVRAYAVNSAGTSYGKMQMFTTDILTAGTEKADFPGGERSGAASFSIGAKIYSGLGYNGSSTGVRDFWEWDQATDIWTRKADYPGNSVSGAVGFSIGSKGYIGTGFTTTGGVTNEFWEYDPATNTWTEKESLPLDAARAGAVGFSIGTKGYIGTGTGTNYDDWDGYSSYYLNDFWEWDQSTNVWTRKADLEGSVRTSAVGFSIGAKGYIGTGFGLSENGWDSGYLRDFWEWDEATDVWTKKADIGFTGRSEAVGFSIGNKGYIGTGYGADGSDASYLRDIWEWDLTTNEWVKKVLLAGTARVSAFGVSVGNKGYIGTGHIYEFEEDVPFNDFWEFDPNQLAELPVR